MLDNIVLAGLNKTEFLRNYRSTGKVDHGQVLRCGAGDEGEGGGCTTVRDRSEGRWFRW